MMFDNQSNKVINPNDKNKLKSHSFNNKNIFIKFFFGFPYFTLQKTVKLYFTKLIN